MIVAPSTGHVNCKHIMIIQITWVLFMMEEYCGPIWAESINAPLTTTLFSVASQ